MLPFMRNQTRRNLSCTQVNNAIDGRSAGWQPTRTTLSLFCNYRVRDVEGPWVLLERTQWQCRLPPRKSPVQRAGLGCLGTLQVNNVPDPLFARIWSALG